MVFHARTHLSILQTIGYFRIWQPWNYRPAQKFWHRRPLL